MTTQNRHALLRAGLVLALGFAAGLVVLAWQRWEAAADLDAELATLEERLTTDGPASLPEDTLGLAVAERMQERFVFAPRPAERFRSVRGVLGDRVLFGGGESAAVGETFDDAEVLAVNAESVRFLKDGEEVTVRVGGGEAGGGGERRGRRQRGERGGEGRRSRHGERP